MVECLLSIHFWFYLQPGAQPGQGFGVIFHLARDEHDELRVRAAAHGLNYTHAAAKKIGPKQARVMHRVFCGVTGLGMAMHIFAVKQPKE